MSSELAATRTSCVSSNGCHCDHPRREAAPSSADDGISSARTRSAVIYYPSDGFRGFCACLQFHCTPRYHASCFCDMTQIDLYAPGLMVTTPSLYCGMRDKNWSNWIFMGPDFLTILNSCLAYVMHRGVCGEVEGG